MRLHYVTSGGQVRRALRPEQVDRFALAGDESAFDFDATTNAETAADVAASVAPFTVVGGQLRKNGVAVLLNADSPDVQDRNDFDSQLSAAATRLGQIKTAADAGLTNAQRDTAIGDLAVILRRTLKLVAQLRKLQR